MSEEARLRKLEQRVDSVEEEVSGHKATLSFSLPMHQEGLTDALDGTGLRASAQEFDNYLKRRLDNDGLSDAERKLCDEIRDELHECFLETPIWTG